LSEHVLKQKFVPKNALFLLKNRRALGVLPPDSLASGGWGFALRPQLPAVGGFAPRPSLAFGSWPRKSLPHDEFLATCLTVLYILFFIAIYLQMLMLRLCHSFNVITKQMYKQLIINFN